MRSIFIRMNGAGAVLVNLCVVIGTLRFVIFWQHEQRFTYRWTCFGKSGQGRSISVTVRPPGNSGAIVWSLVALSWMLVRP